jgi:hypothetical protein
MLTHSAGSVYRSSGCVLVIVLAVPGPSVVLNAVDKLC